MPDGGTKFTDKAAVEAELVAKAIHLAPRLADRARKAELDRRISGKTDSEFRDAGFYRALQPARYGGLELDYGAQTAFSRELGRVCASSGWVAGLLACHGWIGGMCPDEAQGEMWGDDVNAAIATSFLPVAVEIERRAAELTISGRWRFSSGVDHCRWAILLLNLTPEAEDATSDPVFAIVDLTECKIEDAWNSAGLAATGSNDIILDEVDIPPHRIKRIMDMRGGETLRSSANDSYLYRLPLFAVFPFNIIGPSIGAARGALDAVIQDLTNRESVTGADLSQSATAHQRVGRATALLDSAEAVISQLRAEIISKGRAGGQFSMHDRVRYRLNLGHVARTCCDAVDELLPLTGGRGLETSHLMQRAWRDVHAIAQHIGLVWDLQTGLYGNVLLGHGCPDPKL